MSTKIEASPQDAEPEPTAGEHPGVGEHREHRDSLIDTDDVPPEVAIRHLIFGGWTAQALRTMVSLDLADHLAHGSRTVDDLANAAAVDAQTLRRLLAVLADGHVNRRRRRRCIDARRRRRCRPSRGLRACRR